jgi:hypothetical protein
MFELTTPKGEILPLSLRDAWAHVLVAEDITDPADVAGYMGFSRDMSYPREAVETFNDFWTEFGWRLSQSPRVVRYARVLFRDKLCRYRDRHECGVTLREARGMWRNSIQDARYAYRVLALGETL